jgi:hypothetical protein
MERQDPKLREIWSQKKIPIAYRQAESLLIRLPFAPNNRFWLKDNHRKAPAWDTRYKCWQAPRAWFENVVQRILKRFGKVYVIQPSEPTKSVRLHVGMRKNLSVNAPVWEQTTGRVIL